MAVRSIENQAELMRHRTRELLAGHRTSLLNALRGHMAEIGVVAAQGAQHAYALKRLAAEGVDDQGEIVVPECMRVSLRPLIGQIDALGEAIAAIDRGVCGIGQGRRDGEPVDDHSRRWAGRRLGDRCHGSDMRAFASGRKFAAFSA